MAYQYQSVDYRNELIGEAITKLRGFMQTGLHGFRQQAEDRLVALGFLPYGAKLLADTVPAWLAHLEQAGV